MDFHSMNRKDLQALCKKHKIPANLSNLEMAKRLTELCKENGNSSVQGQINVQDENASETESTNMTMHRNVKKVRFSPEHELIEFTRSPEIKRRTRRDSLSVRSSTSSLVNVDTSQLNWENMDRQSRVTRSRGLTLFEGQVDAKKRGIKGVKFMEQKNNVSTIETLESVEGNLDGTNRVVRPRGKKELNDGVKNAGKRGKVKVDEKALDDVVDENPIEEIVGKPGRLTRSRKQNLAEVSVTETKRVKRIVEIVDNNVPLVSTETDEKSIEEIVGKPGRLTRSRKQNLAEVSVAETNVEIVDDNVPLVGTETDEKSIEEIVGKPGRLTRSRKQDLTEVSVAETKRVKRIVEIVDDNVPLVGTETDEKSIEEIVGKPGRLTRSRKQELAEVSVAETKRVKRVVEIVDNNVRSVSTETDENRMVPRRSSGSMERGLVNNGNAGNELSGKNVIAELNQMVEPQILSRRSKRNANEVGDSQKRNDDTRKHGNDGIKGLTAVTRRSGRSMERSLGNNGNVGNELLEKNVNAEVNQIVEPQILSRRSKRNANEVDHSQKLNDDTRKHGNDEIKGSRKSPKLLAADGSGVDAESGTSKVEVFQIEAPVKPEMRRSNRRKEVIASHEKGIIDELKAGTEKIHQSKGSVPQFDGGVSENSKKVAQPVMKRSRRKTIIPEPVASAEKIDTDADVENCGTEKVLSTRRARRVASDYASLEILGEQKNEARKRKRGRVVKTNGDPSSKKLSVEESRNEKGVSVAETHVSVSQGAESTNNPGLSKDTRNKKVITDVGPMSSRKIHIEKQEISNTESDHTKFIKRNELANLDQNVELKRDSGDSDKQISDRNTEDAGMDGPLQIDVQDMIEENNTGMVKNQFEGQLFSQGKDSCCVNTIDDQILKERTNVSGDEGFAENSSSAESVLRAELEVTEAEAVTHTEPPYDHAGEVLGISVEENLDTVETGQANVTSSLIACHHNVVDHMEASDSIPDDKEDDRASKDGEVGASESCERCIDSIESKSALQLKEPSAAKLRHNDGDNAYEGNKAHVQRGRVPELAEIEKGVCSKNLKTASNEGDEITVPDQSFGGRSAKIAPQPRGIISGEYLAVKSDDQGTDNESLAVSHITICPSATNIFPERDLEAEHPGDGEKSCTGKSMHSEFAKESLAVSPIITCPNTTNIFLERDLEAEHPGLGEESCTDKSMHSEFAKESLAVSAIFTCPNTPNILIESDLEAEHPGNGEESCTDKSKHSEFAKESLAVSPITTCPDTTSINLERDLESEHPGNGEESCTDKSMPSEFAKIDEGGLPDCDKCRCNEDEEFVMSNVLDVERRDEIIPQDTEILSRENSIEGFDEKVMRIEFSSCEADRIAEGGKVYVNEGNQSVSVGNNEGGCLRNHKDTKDDDREFGVPDLFDSEKSVRGNPQDGGSLSAEDLIKDFNEQVVVDDYPAVSTMSNEVKISAGSSSVKETSPSEPERSPKSQGDGPILSVLCEIIDEEAGGVVIPEKEVIVQNNVPEDEMCMNENISDGDQEILNQADEHTNECTTPDQVEQRKSPSTITTAIANTIHGDEAWSGASEKTGHVMCISQVNDQGINSPVAEGSNVNDDGNGSNFVEGKDVLADACITDVMGLHRKHTVSDVGDKSNNVESRQNWTETELGNLFETAMHDSTPAVLNDTISQGTEKEKEMEGERGSMLAKTTYKNAFWSTNSKEVSDSDHGSGLDREDNQLKLLLTPLKIDSPFNVDETSVHEKKEKEMEGERGSTSAETTYQNAFWSTNSKEVSDSDHGPGLDREDNHLKLLFATPLKIDSPFNMDETSVHEKKEKEMEGERRSTSAKTTYRNAFWSTNSKEVSDSDHGPGLDREGKDNQLKLLFSTPLKLDSPFNVDETSVHEKKEKEMEGERGSTSAETTYQNAFCSINSKEVSDSDHGPGLDREDNHLKLLFATPLKIDSPSNVDETSVHEKKEKEMEGERQSTSAKTTYQNAFWSTNSKEVSDSDHGPCLDREDNQLKLLFATPLKIDSPFNMDETSVHEKKEKEMEGERGSTSAKTTYQNAFWSINSKEVSDSDHGPGLDKEDNQLKLLFATPLKIDSPFNVAEKAMHDATPTVLNDTISQGTEKEKEMEGERGSTSSKTACKNDFWPTNFKEVSDSDHRSGLDRGDNQLKLPFATPFKIDSHFNVDEASVHEKKSDGPDVSITESVGTAKESAVAQIESDEHENTLCFGSPSDNGEETNDEELNEVESVELVNTSPTVLSEASKEHLTEESSECLKESYFITEENMQENITSLGESCGFEGAKDHDCEGLTDKMTINSPGSVRNLDKHEVCQDMLIDTDLSENVSCGNIVCSKSEKKLAESSEATLELSEADIVKVNVFENSHDITSCHESCNLGETFIETFNGPMDTKRADISSFNGTILSPFSKASNDDDEVIVRKVETGDNDDDDDDDDTYAAKTWDEKDDNSGSFLDRSDSDHISGVDREDNQLELMFATPVKVDSPSNVGESSSHEKKLDQVAGWSAVFVSTTKENAMAQIETAADEHENKLCIGSSSDDGEEIKYEELPDVLSVELMNTPNVVLSEAREELLSENTCECLDKSDSITEENREENIISLGESCHFEEAIDKDRESTEKNTISSSDSLRNLDKLERCQEMLIDTDILGNLSCGNRVSPKSEMKVAHSCEAVIELSAADVEKSIVLENIYHRTACSEESNLSKALTETFADSEMENIGSFNGDTDVVEKGTTPVPFSKASDDVDEVTEMKVETGDDDDSHEAKMWDEKDDNSRSFRGTYDELHCNTEVEILKSPSVGDSLELQSTCKETGTITQNIEKILPAAEQGLFVCDAELDVFSSLVMNLIPGDKENGASEKSEVGTPVYNSEGDHDGKNSKEVEENSPATEVQFSISDLCLEQKVIDSNNDVHSVSDGVTETGTGDIDKANMGTPLFNLEGRDDEKNDVEEEENLTATIVQFPISELNLEEKFMESKNDVPVFGCNEFLKESDVADTIKEYIDSELALICEMETSEDGLQSVESFGTESKELEEAVCVDLHVEDYTADKSSSVETKGDEQIEMMSFKETLTGPETLHSPACVDSVENSGYTADKSSSVETKGEEQIEEMPFKKTLTGSETVHSPACADLIENSEREEMESEGVHRWTSRQSISTAKTNVRTILIHGTPSKVMADMKENAPTHKSSNIGDVTAVRPPKRKALQDVQRN